MTVLSIQPNAHVTIDYELRDEEGDMLEASAGDGGEPIRYVHGYGMLVPGLEAALLVGLHTGDVRDVVVARRKRGTGSTTTTCSSSSIAPSLPDPKGVAVGDEFVAEAPDGDEIAMSVVEVRDDLDAGRREPPARGDDPPLPRDRA